MKIYRHMKNTDIEVVWTLHTKASLDEWWGREGACGRSGDDRGLSPLLFLNPLSEEAEKLEEAPDKEMGCLSTRGDEPGFESITVAGNERDNFPGPGREILHAAKADEVDDCDEYNSSHNEYNDTSNIC